MDVFKHSRRERTRGQKTWSHFCGNPVAELRNFSAVCCQILWQHEKLNWVNAAFVKFLLMLELFEQHTERNRFNDSALKKMLSGCYVVMNAQMPSGVVIALLYDSSMETALAGRFNVKVFQAKFRNSKLRSSQTVLFRANCVGLGKTICHRILLHNPHVLALRRFSSICIHVMFC